MFTLTILVALSETEIDDVDIVTGGFCTSEQKVIRLDITMDDMSLVQVLKTEKRLSQDVLASIF